MEERESDQERWDRKYAAGEGPTHFRPKRFLLEHRHLLSGERALDAACGFGGNALYLASIGFQVDALDVSSVALLRARREAMEQGLSINWAQADLDHWWFPPGRYDIVMVFFYLNRGLMPQLASTLRPGGLLFQAHHNQGFLQLRPDFDPGYLLEEDELGQMATDAGLEILYHVANAPDQAHNSQLIARRP
jgi:2-polyprenyl-3-methyl-5-hydroxy-6-metoxy-1,4-benzoquinol methylase